MASQVSIIGFGEAAQAFVSASDWSHPVRAYDKLTDDQETRSAKRADYTNIGVNGCDGPADALKAADIVLSLVTAGDAMAAAEACAEHIGAGALYCDMNSVAPGTKKRAAAVIAARGASYVDVAIMSPVKPRRLSVPLLISGPAGANAEAQLKALGFSNTQVIGAEVGQASAVKMIRSIIVKGIEALTAEAMMAAAEAGVVDEVIASLDASECSVTWGDRANYNLERMMIHGVRRGEELDEAVRTLISLGVLPHLSRCAALRHREIGLMKLRPAGELAGKIEQLRPGKANGT